MPKLKLEGTPPAVGRAKRYAAMPGREREWKRGAASLRRFRTPKFWAAI
jgi:hypothetical protein